MTRQRQEAALAAAASFQDFVDSVAALSSKTDQGAAFEYLTQRLLSVQPEYRSLLSDVWAIRDLPQKVRVELGLPEADEGIDLVARTHGGEFWAIQCKFKSASDTALTRRDVATFTSLAFHACPKFKLAVVAHTCAKPIRKHELLPNTVEIGLERWLALNDEDWALLNQAPGKPPAAPKPRKPREHQETAIADAIQHFVGAGAARGRLIMPCGTGKSLTALWIARELDARTVLVVVPSLALIRQSLEDWTRELLAAGELPEWLVVCSDESTGKVERDEFVGATYELGIPTTTDVGEIQRFLSRVTTQRKIVFATYQSSAKLAQGARCAEATFDLGVFDEAHKTVGEKSKSFSMLLLDESISIRRRMFMTATERVVRGGSDAVLSMDDEGIYGKPFHLLTFKRAIESSLISDYRVITLLVSDSVAGQWLADRRLVTLTGRDDPEAAETIALAVALTKSVNEHGIRRAVSFHKSIRRAEDFAELYAHVTTERGDEPMAAMSISSKRTAGARAQLLRDFTASPRALIANARCLTEGVDIPSVDCVVFADPKHSVVDIVQAAGRALRRLEGKKFGYIIMPLVVPSGMTLEEFAETTEYKTVARIVTSLSVQDERIAEQFRLIDRGNAPSDPIVRVEGDVPVGFSIGLDEFAERINAMLWERVAKANWRPFEEARQQVRELGLKDVQAWYTYSGSDARPADIPSNPHRTYPEWNGMGDWLGTGVIRDREQFREFVAARDYVRALGLRNTAAWQAYARSDARPKDIPAGPASIYRAQGWSNLGDWLGTGNLHFKEFLPFEKARAYVRGLKLKGGREWRKYATSKARPSNIPSAPWETYRDSGWLYMADWLDYGKTQTCRPFSEARAFARSLGLESQTQWIKFTKTKRRPRDIPTNPNRSYRNDGWVSWGHWLGTGSVHKKSFRPFREARRLARSLNLASWDEWQDYCRRGNRPDDIPAAPSVAYRNSGWAGWGDWLGTGNERKKNFLPFEEARAFARSLNLSSLSEWNELMKSRRRPKNIPVAPWETYRESGYAGAGDWLGTGTQQVKTFCKFKSARAFARSLGLKSWNEWRAFAASDKRPDDIPSTPWKTYERKGWLSMKDWLGA